ncbi:ACP phosphodiesterase [Pelagicoccus mobilis]
MGNLLADMTKGRAWAGAPSEFVRGTALHRQIDRLTDSDPIFKRSSRRIGEQGFLRGIVIDLVYDHFLSKNWRRYSDVALDVYLKRFYEEALESIEGYPSNAQRFIYSLVRSRRLNSYSEIAGIEAAMLQMDGRLSERLKRKETTVRYLPEVLGEYESLETDFLEFFPLLRSRVCFDQSTLEPFESN